MRYKNVFLVVSVLAILVSSVLAQDLVVGDSKMPPLKWGKQTLDYEMTNNTDYLKFIAIKIDIQFSGSYLHPHRNTTSFAYLVPQETSTISANYVVPGNFGKANIKVELYDVVDTLDLILPDQKFFEQPFVLTFRVPEGMQDYLGEKINLPPRVEQHPTFDSEFSRILLYLLNEGRSPQEIAVLANADTIMVNGLMKEFIDYGYVGLRDSVYRLGFPVIKTAEAEETRQLALAVADSLVARVEKNLPVYFDTLASLAQQGLMSADSNEFYDGGSLFYHKYPAIAAFFLWYDLGRDFITRSAPLLLYDNTDPCNAKIPFYMYAVQGGDVFNGSHFYAPFIGPYGYQFIFGDSVPDLDCTGWNRPQRPMNNWAQQLNYVEDVPEVFVVDTVIAKTAMKALAGDASGLLEYAYAELFKLADKHGHYKVQFGQRYWFWNLVATRTLEKLVEKGICQRRGAGIYRFDGLQAKTGIKK